MELNELYSMSEAAEYVGVPFGTWNNHVHVKGLISPIGIGIRLSKTGEEIAHSLLFTRRMLDEYKAGKTPVEPTEAEIDSIFNMQAAAEYVGLDVGALKWHAFAGKNIPSKTVGRDTVFLRRDLDEFKRATARVEIVDGRVGDFPLVEEMKAYRKANRLSQRKLARMLDVSYTHIGGIEAGTVTSISADLYRRIKDLVGGNGRQAGVRLNDN